MAGELLPCPFCGSADIKRDFYVRFHNCKSCGASAPTDRWNTRQPTSERERIVAWLRGHPTQVAIRNSLADAIERGDHWGEW